MIWALHSLFSAAFNGGKAVCDKHLIGREGLSPYTIGFFTFLVAVVVTTPIALYLGEQTAWSSFVFLKATAGNVVLNIIATLLYFKILKKHDPSLVTGIQAIEPLFVTIVAYLMLGETVSVLGLIGILIIIIGGFFLQKSRCKSDLQDFLFHSPWLLMLIYMSITSSATVFSKIAVVEGGVFIYIATRYAIMVVVFATMMRIFKKANAQPYQFKWSHLGSGLMLTGSVIFEMIALQQAKAAYVETLRRLTVFFSLLFESWFLKNKWNMLRMLACFILFVGAAVITLLG